MRQELRTRPSDIRKTPWVYEPSSDVDGDPVYETPTVGTDHFVLSADGDEIACAANEDEARLISAAPDLLAACAELVTDLISHAKFGLNEAEVAMLKRAEAALAKAQP